MSFRVGQGFDIHPFSDDPARALVLAGVRLEGKGLSGHSDGDVVCHAVADALLGAAGLGDIGSLFPDTDQSLAGADSVGATGVTLSAMLWLAEAVAPAVLMAVTVRSAVVTSPAVTPLTPSGSTS